MTHRSVILLATNKEEYLNFALNCAESVRLHNPDLPIFIVTNLKTDRIIADMKFITISDELAKLNIGAKVYLDHFIQTEETLFIDSDCLCYDNLNPVFEACNGHNFTTIGRLISWEDEWGSESAESARNLFGVDKYILGNGGFYYIKKAVITTQIFDHARELLNKYDEYGFGRIKNGWVNEEGPFAIAMVKYNEVPITDDARLMTDFCTDRRPKILNILTGKRLLRNPAYPLTAQRSWYPASFSPVILHFGGNNIKHYPYISQSSLLKLYKAGFPVAIANFIVSIFIHLPFKSYHQLRRLIGLP